jgi:glucokinase
MTSSCHIGVDLGGTNIKFALIDDQANKIAQKVLPTEGPGGPDHVLDRIAGGVKDLIPAAGETPIVSIGMAVPGLFDNLTGVVKFLPNLPTQWIEVPAGPRIREATGIPVWLINDVRAFTVAEHTLGAAKGAETAIFYAIGTGVGGGVVAHGKVNFGVGGAGGELGHMVVAAHGPRCGCGNRGCAEAFATGPAIVGEADRRIRQGATTVLHEMIGNDRNKMSAQLIEHAAEQGDEVAIDILQNAGYYLGLAVANAIAALAPEVVVIGGGNVKEGGVYWKAIDESARSHCHVTDVSRIVFKPAALGYEAGVVGAALWGKMAAADAAVIREES